MRDRVELVRVAVLHQRAHTEHELRRVGRRGLDTNHDVRGAAPHESVAAATHNHGQTNAQKREMRQVQLGQVKHAALTQRHLDENGGGGGRRVRGSGRGGSGSGR